MTRTDHYDFMMRKIIEVVKSAGKWLKKVDSEEIAMLSAMIVSI